MLATQLRGERGDAYVALESVMRAHAGGRGKREAARSTKRKLSGRTKGTGDGERWEEGGGDKRNVESKKQKEKRNIKVRLAGARRR